MNIDKIIYKELHARRKSKGFSLKLQKMGLIPTYKSSLRFYKSYGRLKVPFISFTSKYQEKFCKRKIMRENIICVINVLVFFLALSLLGDAFSYYDKVSLAETIIGISACLGIIYLNFHIILKTQRRKEQFYDVFTANITTILDYEHLSHQDKISDNDLIKFLADLRNTRQALIAARKCGYDFKEQELDSYIKATKPSQNQIAILDNEANPILKKKHKNVA